MIIMNVECNNLLRFIDFSMNFSYPRKINNSLITEEHLKNYNNFRYKKLNLLMGSNATGKTTFGYLLMYTLNYIYKDTQDKLLDCVNDKSKTAYVILDLVLEHKESYHLVRYDIKINPDKSITKKISNCKISNADSYETSLNKLKIIKFKGNDLELIEDAFKIGMSWFFSYPSSLSTITSEEKDTELYLRILKITLMTLDNSIIDVQKLDDVKDSYIIKFDTNSIIVQEGKIIETPLLSSGTKNGLDIAESLYKIVLSKSTLFYLDEKFTHIHSELEIAFLTFMIQLLKPNSQLFFTSHNTELLEINLPKHSYNFFNKIYDGNSYKIINTNVSKYLNKNTDSVKNSYNNDLFLSMPSTNLIDELLDELLGENYE